MRKVKLTQGKFALVDDEDFEKVNKYKWQLYNMDNIHFYAKTRIWIKNKKRKSIRLHRYILGLYDPKIKCDHKNGNGLDNRRLNIRIATPSQNSQNKISHNKWGFKGVSKDYNSWRAMLRTNGKRYTKNSCRTVLEAAKEYDKLAKEHFGEFARTNF
ncbi:MAG: hypothetical protein LAN71_17700 [Acidobacteriia bacterium]|nr:hypothetical protein [Terriglobia bacterium]